MGFRINTNIGALNAFRNAAANSQELNKSLNSLSSGLRINKASDDSAGLAIANKLSAQSAGLGQAIKNANDGIGMIQTADGALEEFGNIMQRVRVLAIQSANDTQDETSRGYIEQEVTALFEAAEAIANTTKFNGIKLLDGTVNTASTKSTFDFQVGAYSGEKQTVSITDMNLTAIGLTSDTLKSVDTKAEAQTMITTMDTVIGTVDGARANLGAAQNKLESTVRNISVTAVNIAAAESNIRDVDFAAESANFAKRNILAQSGSYAMSQANAVQQNVLRLLQ